MNGARRAGRQGCPVGGDGLGYRGGRARRDLRRAAHDGHRRPRARRAGVRGTARRQVIDKVAAAVMLQAGSTRARRRGGRRDDRRRPGARAAPRSDASATSPRRGASTTSTRSTRWRCSTGARPVGRRRATPAPSSGCAGRRARSSGSSTRWSCSSIVARSSSAGPSAGGTSSRSTRPVTRRPVNFTVERRRHAASRVSERLQEQGFIDDAGVFRWYVDRHGGLELTPGLLRAPAQRPHGQPDGAAAHAARARRTRGHVPRGLHAARRSAAAARARHADDDVADFIAAAADPSIVAPFQPPGVTSLEGLLFPDTYQVSNGESRGPGASSG